MEPFALPYEGLVYLVSWSRVISRKAGRSAGATPHINWAEAMTARRRTSHFLLSKSAPISN
jgi:hypothetical protein